MSRTDLRPTRKVTAAGLSGSAALVLVWLLGQVGVGMPPEVASAATALAAAAAGYWVRATKTR